MWNQWHGSKGKSDCHSSLVIQVVSLEVTQMQRRKYTAQKIFWVPRGYYGICRHTHNTHIHMHIHRIHKYFKQLFNYLLSLINYLFCILSQFYTIKETPLKSVNSVYCFHCFYFIHCCPDFYYFLMYLGLYVICFCFSKFLCYITKSFICILSDFLL